MERELKGIKYILFFIALVLLFGAGAVRDTIGTVFFLVILIGGIILALLGLGVLFGNKQEMQTKEEERKMTDEEKEDNEEADKAYFEAANPSWKRYKFLGSTIETNKVDYGVSWGTIILITIGLFVLIIIIGAITTIISSHF